MQIDDGTRPLDAKVAAENAGPAVANEVSGPAGDLRGAVFRRASPKGDEEFERAG
jgi:hypothetical protein